MSTSPKPEIATNGPHGRVADALNGYLAHLRETLASPPELAVATAYFNPGGYGLLADELDHPSDIRILLGAEPVVPERRVRTLKDSTTPARAGRVKLRRALEGHARTLKEDRDLLGFTLEADASARRLVEWLRSGKVRVKRLEDQFLHGKAFIVTKPDPGVLAGSSNFTYAGLATNLELNLGRYEPSVVGQVVDWFDDLWDRAVDFDLAAIYAERFDLHAPQLIYLRMLHERYGLELEEEATTTGGTIHLTGFQKDGLWRAQRILEARKGVLIADEVGLGKTFLAGELIRQAVEERRQRVLVIAPATLRDGPWKKFIATYRLGGVDMCSFEELAADSRLNPDAPEGHAAFQFAPQDYAMVVVDEAHNLRNPSTQRAAALRKLLAGAPAKDVLLLTATPVNNSLWDLYWVLGYFLRNDGVFADAGIRSLRDHFAAAMAMNPDDLSPEHLFDVLDAVAVRRTRSFVKRHYPHDTVKIDGRDEPIVFPTPRVLKVDYDLEEVLPGFFERFAMALDPPDGIDSSDPNVLSLARYAPSRYRLDKATDAYEVQLAGLLRSGLLKRFESSAYAFALTCRTMAASHDAFLALVARGKVGTGAALSEWTATDTDDAFTGDTMDFFDADERLEDAADFDIDALRADVEADRDLLLAFATEADQVTREQDPKLERLVTELRAIVDEANAEGVGGEDTRDKRKVLIFSYYADTVDWIVEHLDDALATHPDLAPYRDRLTSLSGAHGQKETALWGFAPRTTDPPSGMEDDRFDIVVTTDVLSEGVNLQQARHIINYDLPWNPMRLVQRHGRIDRIGSRHREVFLRCVFPDRQLDELLGLEERLHRKISQAAATVGAGQILPGSQSADVTYSETRDEIERLRAGDTTLFEEGGHGKSALSGEEYRQELRKALENPELAKQITDLPWGSGSGMAIPGAQPGFVFCARVGDHLLPQFRYVDMGDPEAPVVVGDTLACLDNARPSQGFDTPRILADETYQDAFDAWRHALDDIVTTWNHLSDPANLMPAVPPAMQRAAAVVLANPPAGFTVEQSDRLAAALQAPYPERTVKMIRNVLAASDDPAEQSASLAAVVADLGLEPAPAPEPLPEIDDTDVHLVCWLAITPEPASADGDNPTIAEQSGALPLGDSP